jgi:hypothetical protein
MEWVLPIQKMEVGNVTMTAPSRGNSNGGISGKQKPLVTLSYHDGNHYNLQTLSILLPPMPVVGYEIGTGKLELDMSGHPIVAMKLQTFQETLLNAIQYNQNSWFGTSFRAEEVRSGFQPFVENGRIYLHCPAGMDGREGVYANGIPIYDQGIWRTATVHDFTSANRKIRIAVKIHGISFLKDHLR